MDLKNKKGLIMGVANDKSIAWGIAQQCANFGAELAFTYQNDLLLKRIDPLAKSVGSNLLIQCDVCLLYTSPSPRDRVRSRMPSSA